MRLGRRATVVCSFLCFVHCLTSCLRKKHVSVNSCCMATIFLSYRALLDMFVLSLVGRTRGPLFILSGKKARGWRQLSHVCATFLLMSVTPPATSGLLCVYHPIEVSRFSAWTLQFTGVLPQGAPTDSLRPTRPHYGPVSREMET